MTFLVVNKTLIRTSKIFYVFQNEDCVNDIIIIIPEIVNSHDMSLLKANVAITLPDGNNKTIYCKYDDMPYQEGYLSVTTPITKDITKDEGSIGVNIVFNDSTDNFVFQTSSSSFEVVDTVNVTNNNIAITPSQPSNGCNCDHTETEHIVYTVHQDDTTDVEKAIKSLTKTKFNNADVLVITDKNGISSGYQYSNKKWVAFTGNVSADNVIFLDDIMCAGSYTQVGNVTKTSSGTTTISATGKTLNDVMKAIFTKEMQPTKTEPSVSISLPQAGAKEVGTTINPTYSVSFNGGSYTYGPSPTGVKTTGYSITDKNSNSSTSASGSFSSFVVGDSTNYSVSVTVSHTDGVNALTNLGKEASPVVKIAAGSKSATSSSVTGYRAFFYGALNTDSSTPLTSAIIRGLTNGGNYNGSKTITINPIAGGKRYIVAIPSSSSRSGLKSAILPNSLNAEAVGQYSSTTVSVEGVAGYTPVNYKVYVYEPASIGAKEIHKITLG